MAGEEDVNVTAPDPVDVVLGGSGGAYHAGVNVGTMFSVGVQGGPDVVKRFVESLTSKHFFMKTTVYCSPQTQGKVPRRLRHSLHPPVPRFLRALWQPQAVLQGKGIFL